MNKTLVLLFTLAVLSCWVGNVYGQTTLINPAGDGGFELGASLAANGWTGVSSTQQFFVGSLNPPNPTAGSYHAYTSTTAGSWTPGTTASVAHIYKDIAVPAGESNLNISLKYRTLAVDATYDYIRVHVVSTSTTPVGGTTLTTGQIAQIDGTTSYTSYSYTTSVTAGTTVRLVISFRQDGYTPYGAAALDEISVISEVPPLPLAGTKTVKTSGGDYSSLTAAINALNVAGVGSGGVVFNVDAGMIFNENLPAISATGTMSNPIVFQKSGAGANPVIKPTGSSATADAGLIIHGGDYITIDGIDIDASAVTTVEYGYLIRNASATNGAQYNTIKNCSVTLNRGTNSATSSSSAILQTASSTGGGITPTNATGANSYNKYYNLSIQSALNGIYLNGHGTYRDISCEIGTSSSSGRNTITNLGPLSNTYTSARGIYAYQQENVKIFNNDITSIAGDQAATYGIQFGVCYGASNEINNNKIHTINVKGSTSTSALAYGMKVDLATSGTNNVRIYNNMISNVFTSYTGSATVSRYAFGMFIGISSATTSQSYDIDNNNVSLGSGLTPTYSNTCLELQNASAVIKLRGNIFANFTNAQTGVAKHFCSVVTSANIGATGSVLDYNVYYIANSLGTSGHVGRNNSVSTNYNTITDWKTFTTGTLDETSYSVDPQFSDNNTDLHVSESSLSAVSGFATQAWVTTDLDNQSRNDFTPSDIGADAFTPTIANPTGFTATTYSNNQIDLSFTATGYDVVIVWNSTGIFTTPSGTPPVNPGDAFAGGFFLYRGTTAPQSHTGISPLTTYYYKAFSYDGSIYSNGSSANARTFGAPSVTSTAASSVILDTAVTGGNVTNDNGGVITERGVCYGTTADPTILDSKVIATGTTGSYSCNLINLLYNTTYNFRAYAINAYGVSYGANLTFATGADPTLTPPLTQDFSSFPPTNWTRFSGLLASPSTLTSTTSGWAADGFCNTGSTGAARLNIWSTSTSYWLVTPPINLNSKAGWTLEFGLGLTDYGSTSPITSDPLGTTGTDDKFAVVISTDNGATWSSDNTLMLWDNAGSPNVYNDISSTGQTISIDLSAYSGVVRIAFYGESTATNADNDLFVDNVAIIAAGAPPTPPTTFVPANNATNVAINTNLSWSGASGSPTGYRMFLGTNPDELSNAYEGTDALFDPAENLLFGTTYHWYVQAYNDNGSADGSVISFSTATGKAITPNPSNNTTTTAITTRTLDWADVAGATGYKISVGTSSGATDIANMIDCATSTWSAPSNWSFGTQYFWKVYTINGSQEVAGDEWNFSTVNGKAITPNPTNNATIVPITTRTLDWADVAGATGYKISVGTSTGATDIANKVDCATSSWTSAFNWAYSTQYYWKIYTLNDTQEVTGDEWNFTTQADPTINVPHYQTFTGITAMNQLNGWTQARSAGHATDLWSISTTTSAGGISPELRHGYGSNQTANQWTRLTSPPLSVSGYTGINIKWRQMLDWDKVYNSLGLEVKCQYSYDGVEFYDIWSQNLTADIPAEERSHNVATNGNPTMYFSWYTYGNPYDMNNWNIDNIKFLLINTEIAQTTAVGGTATVTAPSVTNTQTDQPLAAQVTITNLSNPTANVTVFVGFESENISLPNAGLNLTLGGTSFAGTRVTVQHNLGFVPMQLAYRVLPGNAWNMVNAPNSGDLWTTTSAFFDVFIEGKADGDVEVVFPIAENQTLPVELSSFTYTINSNNLVTLHWVTQSETGVAGYYVYRSKSSSLATASMVSSLIPANNSSGTQSYTFVDSDLQEQGTYYYWLQNIDLDGGSNFYGPVTVVFNQGGNENPVIPIVTSLQKIYPNPFNPIAYIGYGLSENTLVQFKIYNNRGQLVRTIDNAPNTAGNHRIEWNGLDNNGSSCSTGLYLVRMEAGRQSFTQKVVLAK